MSSNTVVPGLNGQSNQPFSPVSGLAGKGSMIPGVSNVPPMGQNVSKGQVSGFLFSVSRTLAGEYWPLVLGANNIGRGPSNSIILSEMTVSENHASIHIISRANKLMVYIKDDQSKTGTLLNGELLRGEADLKSGDILTIGEHYELLVILLNPSELGLKENSEFVNAAPIPPIPAPARNVASSISNRNSNNATVVDGQALQAPVGGHTVVMGGPTK